MTRIFVPQRIPDPARQRLEELGDVTVFEPDDRRISRQELLDAAVDADVLFALGQIPYDHEVINAAERLRMIAAMHVTATFVDISAATERGIPVTGIPNMIAATTAEFTFALLMATLWRLPEADRFVREGRWRQNQSMAFLGSRLVGKTLGVVGLGAIGRGVARRALACDMRVIYTKRTPLAPEDEMAASAEYRALDALFRESDVVVLTPALTAQTRGLVGEDLLRLMRPDAFLINTSRGAVLDEAALERALRQRWIRGAGLDVFEREVPDGQPGPRAGLLELDNVVVTPHMGSAARETREEMAQLTVDNIAAFLAGERPPDVLNPEVYGLPPRPRDVIG
jgi:glyoxylate reductase